MTAREKLALHMLDVAIANIDLARESLEAAARYLGLPALNRAGDQPGGAS